MPAVVGNVCLAYLEFGPRMMNVKHVHLFSYGYIYTAGILTTCAGAQRSFKDASSEHLGACFEGQPWHSKVREHSAPALAASRTSLPFCSSKRRGSLRGPAHQRADEGAVVAEVVLLSRVRLGEFARQDGMWNPPRALPEWRDEGRGQPRRPVVIAYATLPSVRWRRPFYWCRVSVPLAT